MTVYKRGRLVKVRVSLRNYKFKKSKYLYMYKYFYFYFFFNSHLYQNFPINNSKYDPKRKLINHQKNLMSIWFKRSKQLYNILHITFHGELKRCLSSVRVTSALHTPWPELVAAVRSVGRAVVVAGVARGCLRHRSVEQNRNILVGSKGENKKKQNFTKTELVLY